MGSREQQNPVRIRMPAISPPPTALLDVFAPTPEFKKGATSMHQGEGHHGDPQAEIDLKVPEPCDVHSSKCAGIMVIQKTG